jgi:hypothetical protein
MRWVVGAQRRIVLSEERGRRCISVDSQAKQNVSLDEFG